MLRDSVVVRTRPRAIPLAMITIRKILHGFPFLSHDDYGAPLGVWAAGAPLLITTFLTIFRRFPIAFRRFSKIFQNLFRRLHESFQTFSEDYRRLPKITEDFCGGTDDVLIIQQHV